MAKSILVVGSVALDSVKTSMGETDHALGGSAVYFSLAASEFAPVRVVGVVGDDFPASGRKLLSGKGIALDGLETVAGGKTFHWAGTYDKDFRVATTLKTELNVFQSFRPKLGEKEKNCEILFLANIDPDLQLSVLSQMRAPKLVACDTMNFWISGKKASLVRLLKHVDIFFINEEEIRQLTGEYNIIKAGRKTMKMGPQALVVKKGDCGAMLFFKDSIVPVPACAVEDVKDPTGAGDSFGGGFMGSLAAARRWDTLPELTKAMFYGTVIASFNVESFSVKRLGSLSRAELHSRFRKFTGLLKVS